MPVTEYAKNVEGTVFEAYFISLRLSHGKHFGKKFRPMPFGCQVDQNDFFGNLNSPIVM